MHNTTRRHVTALRPEREPGAVQDRETTETLCAFIDGELPPARCHELEMRMRTDRALAAQVAELVQIQALVRLAYGATPTR